MDNYKDECMKRFEYSKSYEKYNQEDLIDELYEKDIQNEDLQQRTEKAIKELQELYNLYKDDDCYTISDKLENALNILKGDDDDRKGTKQINN